MCEYSLEAERAIKAEIGKTYKLGHTRHGHHAFMADDKCETVACMSEGSRLRIEGVSKGVQKHFGVPEADEVVMERIPVESLLDARTPDHRAHYDAVRFSNGVQLRLGYLGVDANPTQPAPGFFPAGHPEPHVVWKRHNGCQATVLMPGAKDAPEDHVLAGPPPPVRAVSEPSTITAPNWMRMFTS